MRIKNRRKGISLVELMITAAIIVAVGAVTRMGINLLNASQRQQAKLEIQRQAQVAMWSISRDVRNATRIRQVHPDQKRLELSIPNIKSTTLSSEEYFDVEKNPQLFENPGLLKIYYYAMCANGTCSLFRAVYRNNAINAGNLKENKRVVGDILLEPPANGTNPIFSPFNFSPKTDPFQDCDGVHIKLRLKHKTLPGDFVVYESSVSKRGSEN